MILDISTHNIQQYFHPSAINHQDNYFNPLYILSHFNKDVTSTRMIQGWYNDTRIQWQGYNDTMIQGNNDTRTMIQGQWYKDNEQGQWAMHSQSSQSYGQVGRISPPWFFWEESFEYRTYTDVRAFTMHFSFDVSAGFVTTKGCYPWGGSLTHWIPHTHFV